MAANYFAADIHRAMSGSVVACFLIIAMTQITHWIGLQWRLEIAAGWLPTEAVG